MNLFERVLLYILAVVSAGMLFIGQQGDAGTNADLAQEKSNVRLSTISRPIRSKPVSSEFPARRDVNPHVAPQDSLILRDDQGRPRIELKANVNGHPQIRLLNEAGLTVISLMAGPENSGYITLVTGKNSARLSSEADGNLTFELSGGEQAHIRLHVTPAGETEVVSAGGSSKLEAVMRTDADGMAEFAVRNPNGGNRPSMAMRPSGEASIEVLTVDGQAGPLMRVFNDGLAEIGIYGGRSKSGPGMIRQADGLSIISLRNSDGFPQASMVTSPDGTAVIAATSADGKQQAALRVDAERVCQNISPITRS